MIVVRKINRQEMVVNCELISTIEFHPHTVICMTTGEKIIVADDREEILAKVIEYKRAITCPFEARVQRPAEAV